MLLPSKSIIHLLGPTTSSKTAVALELAYRLGGEVVNSDKFHCYSGFPVGIGVEDLRIGPRVSAHLYGFLSPRDPMVSIDDYVLLASRQVENILNRGHCAIIEGSSVTFNRALYSHYMREGVSYVAIGVRWEDDESAKSAIRWRVRRALTEGLPQVVDEAVKRGLGDTYVMRKGVAIGPVQALIERSITESQAELLICDGVAEIASSQLARYLRLPSVNWVQLSNGWHLDVPTAVVKIMALAVELLSLREE